MYGNIQYLSIFCCISIFFASHTDAHIWLYTGEDWSEMPLGKRFTEWHQHIHAHKWLQNTAVIRCIIATCRKEPGESRGLSELTSRALYHCSVKKCDGFFLDFERRRDRMRDEGKVKLRWQMKRRQKDSKSTVLKWILQVKYKLTYINSICDMIENIVIMIIIELATGVYGENIYLLSFFLFNKRSYFPFKSTASLHEA